MKYIKITSLIITLIILLTSCKSPKNSDRDMENIDFWMQNAVNVDFIENESKTILKEKEGYSCEAFIQTWEGLRGQENFVVHPANKNVAIPIQKTTDMIIPFSITLKCTTSDISFTTDTVIDLTSSWDNGILFFTDDKTIAESKNKIKEHVNNGSESFGYSITDLWTDETYGSGARAWKGIIGERSIFYGKLKKDELKKIYGYYILYDYFSPAYPDGNEILFPDEPFNIIRDIRVGTETSENDYGYRVVDSDERVF